MRFLFGYFEIEGDTADRSYTCVSLSPVAECFTFRSFSLFLRKNLAREYLFIQKLSKSVLAGSIQ